MNKIESVKAREILDSRGNPTIEATVTLKGVDYTASVPSGASTGAFEAKEIRDGESRYNGKGVLRAVENINNRIAPKIIGKSVDIKEVDDILLNLDGTEDKSNLGANAILAVSMAATRASASLEKKPLHRYIADYFSFSENIPIPLFNIVNGGAHGSGGVSFQEFMVTPQKNTFSENLQFGAEFFYKLKEKITEKYGASSTNIGDEGGFVPNISSEKDVFSLLREVDENTSFLIDVAATEFFKNGNYHFKSGEVKSTEEMIAFYKELKNNFNVLGFEDPLEENDFQGWGTLSKELNDILVVGDDLLVTNSSRIKKAEEHKSCNAIILKINQIGTISEAILAVKLAKEFNWKIIVSHRSGETTDDFIADFAVGIGADYIKSGAPQRGERVAKYNRLLQIEQQN